MTALERLRELDGKRTPGPWVQGWYSGQLPVKAHVCDEPLLGLMDGGYHVHPRNHHSDDHQLSRGVAPFTAVTGNYEYDTGGVMEPADAAFIAAIANNADALMAVAEALDLLGDINGEGDWHIYGCHAHRPGWKDSCSQGCTRARAALRKLEDPTP